MTQKLTTKRAAAKAGVSQGSIQLWIKKGHITAEKVDMGGTRPEYLIDGASFDAYLSRIQEQRAKQKQAREEVTPSLPLPVIAHKPSSDDIVAHAVARGTARIALAISQLQVVVEQVRDLLKPTEAAPPSDEPVPVEAEEAIPAS